MAAGAAGALGSAAAAAATAAARPRTVPAHRQAELEALLFSIMRNKGFGEEYVDCYRMVTAFFTSRRPIVILLCGTAWTGGRRALMLLPALALPPLHARPLLLTWVGNAGWQFATTTTTTTSRRQIDHRAAAGCAHQRAQRHADRHPL
jgi:hypothetical protein